MNIRKMKRAAHPPGRQASPELDSRIAGRLLADVPPQSTVRLAGYLPGMPPERRAQLQAYGLLPGQSLRVLQHKPVTIIQVDLTELALETELARAVMVV